MTEGFKEGPREDLSCDGGGKWGSGSKKHKYQGLRMSPRNIQNQIVSGVRGCLDLKE